MAERPNQRKCNEEAVCCCACSLLTRSFTRCSSCDPISQDKGDLAIQQFMLCSTILYNVVMKILPDGGSVAAGVC